MYKNNERSKMLFPVQNQCLRFSTGECSAKKNVPRRRMFREKGGLIVIVR